jgi:hypothetical protein
VVQPGDMVAGTNVAWYTQPALTFNVFNFAGDILSGTAPPSKYFWMWVHAYGWGPDWWHGYWKGSNGAVLSRWIPSVIVGAGRAAWAPG